MPHSFIEIRLQIIEANQWFKSLEDCYKCNLPTKTILRIYRKHFKK